MANIKSSKKDIRRIKTRTAQNRVVVSSIRTLRKKAAEAVEAGDATAVADASANYASALDKAAKRGIIHANKANRAKSRLAKAAAAKATAAE